MRDSAVDAVEKFRRVPSGEDQVADELVRCDRRTTVLKKQTKNSLCEGGSSALRLVDELR